jgi:hypothetical protein
MIAMPDFSESITEDETKRLCSLAAEVFKEYRESVGYRNGEVSHLAFVQFANDRFGKY